MSHEDEEQIVRANAGGMVDHIQRYKQYITNLKKGQSSGISAAFGRASDLLPADVMELQPPQTKPSIPAPDLGDRVISANFDKNYLRQTIENIISDCAAELEHPIGKTLHTPYGELTVEDVFVEEGRRHFLLSDLRVIDESEFLQWSSTGVDDLQSDDFADEAEEEIASDDFADDAYQGTESDSDEDQGIEGDNFADDEDEAVTGDYFDGATEHASEDFVDEADEAVPNDHFADDYDEVLPSRAPITAGGEMTQLTVTSAAGSFLWKVFFKGFDPERVVMFDGSMITRAEGRDEHVLALRSADGKDLKIYILSGFMVDPSTGNIFVEANEGVYTAAFLNNGWRVHQYRTHDRGDQFYVTEPSQIGREPATMEVVNLNLNIETGEVSYETMDSAATITLRSRALN